jgi:5-methylcytosine-specific restriction endonuclease McrA
MTAIIIGADGQRRKTCIKCGAEKLETEFRKRRKTADGKQLYFNSCIVCDRPYFAQKAREFDKRHPGRRLEHARNCRNRKPAGFYSRSAKALLRRERNILGIRAAVNRRRIRELNAPGSHTAEDLANIFEKQDGRCNNPYCKRELTYSNASVDHTVPLAKGGTNFPDNLAILCLSCNKRKHTLDLRTWLDREKGRAVYWAVFFSLLASQLPDFAQET